MLISLFVFGCIKKQSTSAYGTSENPANKPHAPKKSGALKNNPSDSSSQGDNLSENEGNDSDEDLSEVNSSSNEDNNDESESSLTTSFLSGNNGSAAGGDIITGINNPIGICYLNAGLQALFTAHSLNNYARLFAEDAIFANNQFVNQYFTALRRYEEGVRQGQRPITVSDLSSLAGNEHDSFLALQQLMIALSQMPDNEQYFKNIIIDIRELGTSNVQELVREDFVRNNVRHNPEYVIVMINNHNNDIFGAAQQNKITFNGLRPVDNATYSMIASVVTGYEGIAVNPQQPNHVVSYKKVLNQWYFVNDSQFEQRDEEEVRRRLNQGNANDQVFGRDTRYMMPSTLIYEINR